MTAIEVILQATKRRIRGPKVNRVFDDALDGVLLIDEAYSLFGEDGQDQFGAEAVQTLLKRMEDDRARLVVVAPLESRTDFAFSKEDRLSGLLGGRAGHAVMDLG